MQKVYKLYKDNQDRLMQEIANIMLKYDIKEEYLKLSDIDKQKLNKTLTNEVLPLIQGETDETKKAINNLLSNYARDEYLFNSFLLSIGLDFKLKMITDKELKKIINSKVQGELWSSRLWSNKNKLQKELRKEIFDFLNGKTSVNSIYKRLEDLFKRNRYETKRLTETELARVMQEANNKFGENHNVDWQMFSATLDMKTSKICRSYDGKKFRIDDKSKPVPPLHPNCRSCLINIPSADYEPRTRYDNEKKEIVPYITYEEWKADKGL